MATTTPARGSSVRPDPMRPARLLVHPLFLAALLVLAVNDHLLKGAGLLPGWLTGKLSDFAGLLVALVLLSALLARRARHVVGLAALLGVVFAAIKVDAGAAALLEAATASLGVPWSITVDPTDLLALPVLVLGLRWIARQPVAAAARWTPARALSGTVAAAACLATSPPPPGPQIIPVDFDAQVAVLNDTNTELTARLRPLRDEIDLDCFAIVGDPAGWLTEAAFGPATSWIMPDRSMVPAWEEFARDCYASLLEVDGTDSVMLFWDDELVTRRYTSPLPEGQNPDSQTIVIAMESGNRPVIDEAAGMDLIYAVDDDEPDEVPAECVLAPRAERIDWAEPVPTGEWELVEASYGTDGCWRLDLGEPSEGTGEGTGVATERWYACVPEYAFPFAAGDTIEISAEDGSGGSAPGRWEAIRLYRAGDAAAELREAQVLATRGEGAPELRDVEALAFSRETGCPAVFDDCGGASRAGYVTIDIGDDEARAHSGDSVIPGISHTLHVVHAAEAFVADATCGIELGITLELISVFTAEAEEETP